jgi:hypothetical protein
MGAFGSRPLVTARVMRAVRFSWSDQPLLLRHQRIDPRRLPVEESHDGALLVERRQSELSARCGGQVHSGSRRTSRERTRRNQGGS